MGTRSEEIETAQEKAQIAFVERVLSNNLGFKFDEHHSIEENRHIYEDARASISEIIHIARDVLKMPEEELAFNLVRLRNDAAHARVDIILPTEIEQLAEKTSYEQFKAARAQKKAEAPGNSITNASDIEGLHRTLGIIR